MSPVLSAFSVNGSRVIMSTNKQVPWSQKTEKARFGCSEENWGKKWKKTSFYFFWSLFFVYIRCSSWWELRSERNVVLVFLSCALNIQRLDPQMRKVGEMENREWRHYHCKSLPFLLAMHGSSLIPLCSFFLSFVFKAGMILVCFQLTFSNSFLYNIACLIDHHIFKFTI